VNIAVAQSSSSASQGRSFRRGLRPSTLAYAAIGVAVALTATACGTTADNAAGGQATGELKLGYSAKYLTDSAMAILQKQTLRQAEDAGFTVLPAANANRDAVKQGTDVRSLINQGATALIVIPTDGKAVVPAIDYANTQKVPVVTIDDAPAGGKAFMVVRTDNYLMGKDACTQMGRLLNGDGKVLEIQGDLATPNGLDRSKGFQDCMAQDFPGIAVIAKPGKWDPAIATASAQTVINSTPDIAGVYMASDTGYLNPVLETLRKNNRTAKVGEAGHVALVSIDGSSIGLNAIRDGQLDTLISQPIDLYAKFGVFYAKAAAQGQTFKEGPTDHGSTIVNYNGSLMDALPGVLVTKTNVDDKSLWGNQAL
jgi:ABC-type sugar transport system substrate-binding protein